MSSTTLPVCPKTGSTSPSLTVHLCLHTAPGNRECAHRWYAQNWIPTSNAMPSPVSARRLVSEVNTADMLEIQAPTWHVKAETASAVHQRIRGVLGWVIAMNLRNDNSCDRVLRCSVRRTTSAERHRDAPAGPAPQGRGRGHRDGTRVGLRTGRIKAAFEILVLTAVRPGEARGARWEEIDFGEAAWTIPAARMKATREHRVPLSARAIEVLHATERLRTGSTPAQSAGLVFPSAPGKQLADARLSKLLEQLGVGAVPHGSRSSFRDWASERPPPRSFLVEPHAPGGVFDHFAGGLRPSVR